MSINDFILFLNAKAWFVTGVLVAIPVLALVLCLVVKKGDELVSPWKYGYSVLVYLACIPGMFSAVLVCYALFFSRQNLLEANALIYFLPLLTMSATLIIIRRRMTFRELPGFGRLSGLMTLLALSFALALAIDKTRLFLGFFSSIESLFILVGGIFTLLKTSMWLAFGRKKAKSR